MPTFLLFCSIFSPFVIFLSFSVVSASAVTMPTRKVSSCFFYLMSSEFKEHEGNGWQTPNTQLTFGIDHTPSAIPDAPLPAGLTREESRRVYKFIQEAHGTEASERLKFIDSDASDASWAAHRATW